MFLSMPLLRPWTRLTALSLATVVVAACSSSASTAGAGQTTGPTVAPTAVVTPVATQAPAASLALPSLGTAVPTSLDPCQLVPASEASALTGASYTTGKEETTSGNGKICWYGSQTKNVFEVIVAQAPDVATAQKARDAMLAEVNAQTGGIPFKMTQLTGVGDSAEFVSFSALSISAAGIYVLKGTVFFALVDEVTGAAAPTQAAMVAEAQTVIGRLP